MTSRKKIFSSASVIASSTFLSRILGFVRDMVIASFFGAGASADAFFVAFRIPNLFRRLLAEGSLTTAYIPVFTTLLNRYGKDEASRFGEASFRFFAVFLFFFTLLGVAAAPLIIRVTAPGFFDDPQKALLAVSLTKIMFPYLFFICLVALCMGILNSLDHFAAPAIAPVFLNICMISSVFLLYDYFEKPVFSLAIGVVAGGVVQLLFQFPFLFKNGVNPFKGIGLWHREIKKVVLLMGPTLFGAAVYQLSILVNTILASILPEGSVSFLYYSDRLVQFPLGIFGITAGIVVLPLMSRQVAENKKEEIKNTLSQGICFILFITIPATAGLIVLGDPIISLLFERGEFTKDMRYGTYLCLVYYSLGLFAASVLRILVSFFYSFKDAKTVVKAGVIGFTSNIFFAIVLMNYISYSGLALAVSIGTIINMSFLLIKVKEKIDRPDWKMIIKRFLLILFSTFIMSLAVYYTYQSLELYFKAGVFYLFLKVLFSIFTGVVVYFTSAYLTGLPEIKTIYGLLRRKV